MSEKLKFRSFIVAAVSYRAYNQFSRAVQKLNWLVSWGIASFGNFGSSDYNPVIVVEQRKLSKGRVKSKYLFQCARKSDVERTSLVS